MVMGEPGRLLNTTAATAPAASALVTLVKNEQVPREIKAMVPLMEPAGNGLQPRGSPTSPA